jgi:hypothetical protein
MNRIDQLGNKTVSEVRLEITEMIIDAYKSGYHKKRREDRKNNLDITTHL